MEQERKVEPIGRELVRRLLPRRDPEGHKGTFGKVLCLCGSVGYTGAPVFASRGAVRSGAGLVFLGVPESIWPVAAVKSDEAMPFPLPEAEGRLSLLAEETIRRRAAGCDAVLLGCGLGRGRQTDALVRRLMDLPQPLVLDADGINALAGHMDEWERRRGRVTVLTPHEGEFLRVGGDLSQGRTAAAEDFARRSGAVVVLKGPGTVVAGPDGRCRVNTTGNCGMAKGGSGDVLSGVVLALLGLGMDGLRCLLLRRMAPRPGRGSGGAGEGAVGHDTHGSSGASAAGPAGSDGIERRRETESLPEGRRR